METLTGTRIKRVRQAIEAAGATALLETHRPNVYYLTGFTGDSGALLVEAVVGDIVHRWKVHDTGKGRSAGSPRPHPSRPASGRDWGLFAQEETRPGRNIARSNHAGRLGCAQESGREGHSMGVPGRSGGGPSRGQGSDGDRSNSRCGATGFRSHGGSNPPDPARCYGARDRRRNRLSDAPKGASGESFEAIVAAGPRSALPHARPTARRIGKNELVVLDLGAILRHYCSDLTRTVYVGRAPARVRRWYRAVLEAQAAARDALKIRGDGWRRGWGGAKRTAATWAWAGILYIAPAMG